MATLHVDLHVRPADIERLKADYLETFRPAISVQPGFLAVGLLVPVDDNAPWRLAIEFEDEESRLAWVRTSEHRTAWARIERHMREFSPRRFGEVR